MKTKFLITACCLFALASFSADTIGTIQNKIFQSSQFTRNAATNETDSGWRLKLDVPSTAQSQAISNNYRFDLNATNVLLVALISDGNLRNDNNTLAWLAALRSSVTITTLNSGTLSATNLSAQAANISSGNTTNTHGKFSTLDADNLNATNVVVSGSQTNTSLASPSGVTNNIGIDSNGMLVSKPSCIAKIQFGGVFTNNVNTNATSITNLFQTTVTNSYFVGGNIYAVDFLTNGQPLITGFQTNQIWYVVPTTTNVSWFQVFTNYFDAAARSNYTKVINYPSGTVAQMVSVTNFTSFNADVIQVSLVPGDFDIYFRLAAANTNYYMTASVMWGAGSTGPAGCNYSIDGIKTTNTFRVIERDSTGNRYFSRTEILIEP